MGNLRPFAIFILCCFILTCLAESVVQAGQLNLFTWGIGVYTIPLPVMARANEDGEHPPVEVTLSADLRKKHVEICGGDADKISLDMFVDCVAWDQNGIVALAGDGKLVIFDYSKKVTILREYLIPGTRVWHMEIHDNCVVGRGNDQDNDRFNFKAFISADDILIKRKQGASLNISSVLPYRNGVWVIYPEKIAVTHQSLKPNEDSTTIGREIKGELGIPSAGFMINGKLVVVTDRLALIEFDPELPSESTYYPKKIRSVDPLRAEAKWPMRFVGKVGHKVYFTLIDGFSKAPFSSGPPEPPVLMLYEIDFEKQVLRSVKTNITKEEIGLYVWNGNGLYLVSKEAPKLMVEKEKLEAAPKKKFQWSTPIAWRKAEKVSG